jgi:hypothetical protein
LAGAVAGVFDGAAIFAGEFNFASRLAARALPPGATRAGDSARGSGLEGAGSFAGAAPRAAAGARGDGAAGSGTRTTTWFAGAGGRSS